MVFPEEYGKYLSNEGQRDKIMSLMQFVPMMIATPALQATGSHDLFNTLVKLSDLADSYRAIQRFSGLFNILTPSNITATTSQSPGIVRTLSIGGLAASTCFFPSEHLAVLTKWGVIPGGLRRQKHFGNIAVFFWFWSLLLKTVRLIIQWVEKRRHLAHGDPSGHLTSNHIKRQIRAIQLDLVGTVSYLIFSMTCIGGKVRPFTCDIGAGVCSPINMAFEALTPPRLVLPMWARGLLGTVASVVVFM